MRKRRIIIFDKDRMTWSMMKYFFFLRGEYEVLASKEPETCPVWQENETCALGHPCADVVMIDLSQSGKNGLELIRSQSGRGCRVPIQNRVLMAGPLDQNIMKEVLFLGCGFFQKPFNFNMITTWLNKREQLSDLNTQLQLKRKEHRYETQKEIFCSMPPNEPLGKGTAISVSQSGLAIKTDFCLKQDQVVSVHFVRESLDPRLLSVRWINKIEDNQYVAGLRYW